MWVCPFMELEECMNKGLNETWITATFLVIRQFDINHCLNVHSGNESTVIYRHSFARARLIGKDGQSKLTFLKLSVKHFSCWTFSVRRPIKRQVNPILYVTLSNKSRACGLSPELRPAHTGEARLVRVLVCRLLMTLTKRLETTRASMWKTTWPRQR